MTTTGCCAVDSRSSPAAGRWTSPRRCAPTSSSIAASVAPALARLVDASMVTFADVDGVRRFGMLDTLRHFAGEQLELAGERDAVRGALLEWCVAVAGLADEDASGAAVLDHEFANVRGALDAAIESAELAGRAAELLLDVQRSWLMHGHLDDARRLLLKYAADASLARCPARPALRARRQSQHPRRPPARRRATRWTSVCRWPGAAATTSCSPRTATSAASSTCNAPAPNPLATPSPRCWRSCAGWTVRPVSARRSTASPTSPTCAAITRTAVRHRDAADEVDRAIGDDERLATGLARRAIGAINAGDLDEARIAVAEAQQIAAVAGSSLLIAWVSEAVGRLATATGDIVGAYVAHAEALQAYEEIGTDHDRCAVHLDLAVGALIAGELDRAAAELRLGLPALAAAGVDRFVADGLDLAAALIAPADAGSAAQIAATVDAFRRSERRRRIGRCATPLRPLGPDRATPDSARGGSGSGRRARRPVPATSSPTPPRWRWTRSHRAPAYA